MVSLGYKLSSEEHAPGELVRLAQHAEASGFSFAMISDHFHPWVERQGESPFVWTVLGAVLQATRSLIVGTAVTCPTMRVHPAIVAQAAATTTTLAPGRFILGLGTGENLNEHILGGRWPSATERRSMLAEAVQVIRGLWAGGSFDHAGRYYQVDRAQLYTLPDRPPPILVAAAGPRAAALAGEHGDGMIGLAPDRDLLAAFDGHGGTGKPRYAEITVCWAPDRSRAEDTVRGWWPNAGLGGELSSELALPKHVEQAVAPMPLGSMTGQVVCGPDLDDHVEAARRYIDAGYDHIWFHQIGPDQDGFFDAYERHVLPELAQDRSTTVRI